MSEEKTSAIKLYPNPSSGQFTIELHFSENITSDVKIGITNIMGQIVHIENANIIKGGLQKNISLSPVLSSGIYIVKIIVNKKIYQAKLIYEK